MVRGALTGGVAAACTADAGNGWGGVAGPAAAPSAPAFASARLISPAASSTVATPWAMSRSLPVRIAIE
jgi:hypothetical protein